MEVLFLLAKAPQVVIGEAEKPVFQRVQRLDPRLCCKLRITKIADRL